MNSITQLGAALIAQYLKEHPQDDPHSPYHTCPQCGSRGVYGNGRDAQELACPVCGLQYNPAEIPYDGRPVPYESESDDYGLQPKF